MQERLGLRTPDLDTKNRAINPNGGMLMPHSVSRHLDHGGEIYRINGNKFKQGSLFPAHVKSGDITKIERTMMMEYHKYKQGKKSKILSCKNAGGANRVTMKLNQYGVNVVGSFIRRGELCTIFPDINKNIP